MRKWLAAACVLALSFAGCTAGQQRRASGTANDAYLTAAVGAKVATVDVDAVTQVHVAVSHGVVTLSGQAHSTQERLRYENAAKSVNGVTRVLDRLKVNPHAEGLRGQASDAALAARISAAIAGQAGVNAFHVQPAVHRGNVTLRGTASSQSVHRTILETVRRVPGVKSVTDRIAVPR